MSEELIKRCIRGDRKAQEKLYRDYYAAMASLCLRYAGNEQDAREVLNNAFLKVFRQLHTYQSSKATLYTWIRTIVIHACIDHLRRRDHFRNLQQLDQATADIGIDPEAVSRLKVQELLGFIRELPAATQAVFNLYVMEGYTHREIASLLQISEGTSKWHLAEAKKRLQQKIRTEEVSI